MRTIRQPGFSVWTRAARAYSTVVLILGLAVPAVTRADDKYDVVVERNVGAKMRDGATLRADIYRPKAEGKFPVLLVRTPYDRTGESYFGMRGAARGYVVIAQ